MSDIQSFDLIFLILLPYAAFVTFIAVSIYRYRAKGFTYSSLSSQFLENRQHFWGINPFHYGIIIVLLGHLVAFLFPGRLLAFNRVPLRLYILETSALIFAILTLIGIVMLMIRRFKGSKLTIVTSPADWILSLLLLFQILSGIWVALFHRWGSSWFAAVIAPYLWSLFKFNPDTGYISPMPLMVKLHIIIGFLIIGVVPFTRLVHILVAPVPYLWRKTQVVRWYGKRKSTGESGYI